MVDIKTETGKEIKRLREEKNLSQRELAQSCGISYSNLNKIENGKVEPGMETLVKLSQALGAGLIGKELGMLHNNTEELMISLFKHVVKYHIPESLDLKTIIKENPTFYNDTVKLVIDVVKSRVDYYVNEKKKPRNSRDVSSSKFLDENGEQPPKTLNDFF